MSLISLYEQHLEDRLQAGELRKVTKKTSLTCTSFILEALVGQIPVDVAQAYCAECGALTHYSAVIRDLAEIAKNRKQHTDELKRVRGAL